MMDKQEDVVLIGSVLSGDKEAFSGLVRKYQDFAYGVAVGMLSDFELARDVAQEAFLCAYRNLDRLKDPERFSSWLRGIVKNTALHAIRDRQQVLAWLEELPEDVRATCESSPLDRVLESERQNMVHHALERLDGKNREAVSLYYVDGLSYAQIADLLSVSTTVVKGRIQRGRAQLREELEMVEDAFDQERLSEDFSEEIAEIINAWAERGVSLKADIDRLAEIGAPAVDPLCDALKDPRRSVHTGAARALCAIGDVRAVRPLVEAVASHWDMPRCRFLNIAGAREALLRILREGSPDEKRSAMGMLSGARGDNEVFDAIYESFKLGQERKAALEALWAIRPESAPELLSELIGSGDPSEVGGAMWNALQRGTLVPIETCLKAFGDAYSWGARVAAAACILRHGQEGRRVLRQLLASGTEDERATAAVALSAEGGEQAFQALKSALLKDPRDFKGRKWRKTVARALARHHGSRLLAWAASEPDRASESAAVAWALARRTDSEVAPIAEHLFREGTPAVRAAAVRMLARARGGGFLPELRECLREVRPSKVACEAYWQMCRLGAEAAPTAREMLGSDSWGERKAAVSLLRRWGMLTPEMKSRAEQDACVAVRNVAVGQPKSRIT